MSMIFENLPHIIIGVCYLHSHGIFTVLLIQKVGALQKHLLFCFKQSLIMISDNVVRGCLLHIAAYAVQMKESLSAFCVHGV